MTPTLEITTPEEFQAFMEREFSRFRVSLRTSYDSGVEATLWIEVPEELKPFVQHRAAALCAQFHDATRKFILPIVLTPEEAAQDEGTF